MKIQGKIIWGIYFILYFVMTIANIFYFFSPQNQIYWYYQVLMAFDMGFIVPYLLNALSIILNTLSLLPLYGLMTGRAFLRTRFWGYFLALRLLMDFFGKSFEFKLLKSYFFENPTTAWASIGMIVAFSLPSYIGIFVYATRLKKSK